MELPDCPPGAEGYQDTVVQMPNKFQGVDEDGRHKEGAPDQSTKAEKEFQEHLNSLKIKIEDGSARPMVERQGRDVSGKWIYLCYPCAAMCSGESVLQTHISGKKHKNKLSLRNVWPKSIFEQHPYFQGEKGKKPEATEKVLQKMAEEVDRHNQNPTEFDLLFNKYRELRCHIQDTLDLTKAPLIGVEYLVEHPPEQEHYEPSYVCILCSKQGHPRTIINHMTCFWHRYNYIARHFSKACNLLGPFRHSSYREGIVLILNRLAQRIEDTYGRLKPMHIDKEVFGKNKEDILKWMFQCYHCSENNGNTFEEVVDTDLIETLNKSAEKALTVKKRDPSPPVVAAPTKPMFNDYNRPLGRRERQRSPVLSDISDDMGRRREPTPRNDRFRIDHRYEPYPERKRDGSPSQIHHRYNKKKDPAADPKKARNYQHKLKLAETKMATTEDAAKRMLTYHEKNPEKHPLYPEEWKKFWNRRYKEIQAEGKDPSKHDFKPEWIVYWTSRMKALYKEELRSHEIEIYRKYCLTPPPEGAKRSDLEEKPEPRRRSPEFRRRSPEHRRRSPDMRREDHIRRSASGKRSPVLRRRSPEIRRRSPEVRRRSPPQHRRSRSPLHSNNKWRPIDRSHELRKSPPHHRTTSRSPQHERVRARSRSPLSRRAPTTARNPEPHPAPHPAPSLQTVLVSDDELKPDDGLSPWNSDDSLGSLPDARSPSRSHASSPRSRRPLTYLRPQDPQELGSAENVVATLRLLVALEDYLGSLGPKIVDLLTEALKMEKEEANSSEELLVRDSAVVLIETAKEKLKGAVQAGLVSHNAAAAVRSAVVRAAATLHEADNRAKKKQLQQPTLKTSGAAAVSVAGVGSVDRAQIAQQMAAALIAQGKTDVSPEELQQLVDAVVGMAEAKKREADAKTKQEARASVSKSVKLAALSGTASALQMLQSAYDENEKRTEKEPDAPDVPDAMDGLSDSDLETLLKNFSELSAEEQHSLIAYLKKMEAREPQRVEKLRQYVSSAATASPPVETPAVEKPATKLVTIESDDDDYTVEDVVKSAKQKVKEDQIRQEMEVVTKSLLETNAPTESTDSQTSTIIDLTKNMSSATDLFALVQASLKSTIAPKASSEVVTTNTQPRSFGDPPEEQAKPLNVLLQQTLRNLQATNANAHIQNDNLQSQPLIPEQAFGTDTIYDKQRDEYGSQSQGFGQASQSSYDNQSQGFNNQQGGFGDQNQRFVNQQGYDNDNFENQQVGFGNNQANYSDQQGQGNYDNYGNQQDNYGNQQVDYVNQQDMYANQPANFRNQPTNFGNQPVNFGNQPDNFGNQPDNFGNQPDNFGNQPDNFGNQGYNNQSQGFGNQQSGFGDQQDYNNSGYGNRRGNQNFGGNRKMNRGGFNQGSGNNFPNKNLNKPQFGNHGNQQYGNNQSRGGRGGRGNFRGGRGRGRGFY